MNLNCPRPQWLQPLPCSALSLKAPSWPWSSHPVCWTPFPLWCMSPTGWALGHFRSAFFWVSTFNPCFHLSERREVKVKVSQSCPTATPWIIQSMDLSRPEYWNGYPFPSPGDLSNLGIKPRSPALQADSLPAEPRRKPKNTGLDSLSLLQRIFLIQELNWGLLHCRWILYQLSYEGSPKLWGRPSATKLKKNKRQSLICFLLSLKPLKTEHSPPYPKTWHKFIWDRT